MVALTVVQTPLVLGKKPEEQVMQVKGAMEVALRQLFRLTVTQLVTPLVVWRPNPVIQVAQAVIEV